MRESEATSATKDTLSGSMPAAVTMRMLRTACTAVTTAKLPRSTPSSTEPTPRRPFGSHLCQPSAGCADQSTRSPSSRRCESSR
ncbi:hypothetical protein [Sorangium sp. So ce1078]|uniref:hypothetical protein n=1 Tax=Sorangium sp. So ce1078 TaxID=3133329 RepID=UPI003F61D531